jgi:hypothetical protein
VPIPSLLFSRLEQIYFLKLVKKVKRKFLENTFNRVDGYKNKKRPEASSTAKKKDR